MPIYDYKCSACAQTFELLVRSSTVPACPSCHSTAVEKQLSLTAPIGKIPGMVRSARSQAAKEGHFSHYSATERPKT